MHGSAYKGDAIPGCSDLDLKLFLDEQAFTEYGQLPLAVGMAIQRDLAQIDPAPFQYIQSYARGPHPQPDYVDLVPGAYHLLVGRLPFAEATAAQLHRSACNALSALSPYPAYMAHAFLEHGGGKLERAVRFACTDVWPTLNHIVTLQQGEGTRGWRLPKRQVMALLAPESELARTIHAFYSSVVAYYQQPPSVEPGLATLANAVAFLTAARGWWDAHGQDMAK